MLARVRRAFSYTITFAGLLCGLVFVPVMVAAQTTAPKALRLQFQTGSGERSVVIKLLNGVALNAAAGTRTITLNVGGFTRVTMQANITRVAATDFKMQCSASLDGGASYGRINSMRVSSGVGTMTPFTWSRDTSAGSENLVYDLLTGTYDWLQCVFSGTAAGASDLVTLYAIAGSG